MSRGAPNLRQKFTLAALLLAALAVLAAGIAVHGLSRTQRHAAEAMAAQQRIEGYSALSARVNEWMLGWLAPGAQQGEPPSSFPVTATFGLMDRLVAEDVQAAPNATETATRARQGITLARVRGQFTRLERALAQSPPGTPAGDAALAVYGAQVPGLIAAQIHQETRRREAALAAMAALRGPLHALALAIAIGAPLLLIVLYLALLRPVFRRLEAGAESAPVHDELGLLFARVRQMTARLDRRARRLAADRARLEALVAERTEDLSAANARLSRADAERRRFFADVGHELRTPLTVILGEAELGERHEDPALRASFRTIHSRALRLARRIEDLLRIARSESGRLDLDCQPVDLASAAQAALDDMAVLLRRAGVVAELEVEGDLCVAGDADWLRQVLSGLLENAAKYAGRGAVVRIRGQSLGARARLDVTDTGPGIAPALLEPALARFGRGDTREAGFGVGLALARWVIEAQGGRLTAISPVAEGRGLTIRIDLPRAAAAQADLPRVAAAESEVA